MALAYILVLAGVTVVRGQIPCFQCKDVLRPSDCQVVVTCGPNQVCFSDEIETPDGRKSYDIGCRNKAICDMISQLPGEHTKDKCSKCCSGPYCNQYMCDTDTEDPVGLQCYSCHDIADPRSCGLLRSCPATMQCYTEFVITDMMRLRYNMGCRKNEGCALLGFPRKRAQTENKNTHLCQACCKDSFCNREICAPETPTTTTTELQTTPLPPTTPIIRVPKFKDVHLTGLPDILEPLSCFKCTGISSPTACQVVVKCHPHEMCFAEEVRTQDEKITYNVGCRARKICEQTAFTSGSEDGRCSHCCTEDYCNMDVCGVDEVEPPGLQCFNCQDVADPRTCGITTICPIDTQCYTEYVITDMMRFRFNMGCKADATCALLAPHRARDLAGQRDKRLEHLCQECCKGNFCNKGICAMALPSTTPTASAISTDPATTNSSSTSPVASTDLMTPETTDMRSSAPANSASPSTAAKTTASPSTPAKTTASPSTAAKATASPSTAPTTTAKTSTGLTTAAKSSAVPTTTVPPPKASTTTALPSTAPSTTASPSTAPLVSASPSIAPTTIASASTAPTHTASPSTAPTSNASPSTALRSTALPSTAPMTTPSPATASASTASPSSALPSTASSSTATPLTPSPSTESVTTIASTMSTPGGFSCYSCSDIHDPRACNNVEVCPASDDTCYVKVGLKEGVQRYSMGCKKRHHCHNTTHNYDLCCGQDRCNKDYISDPVLTCRSCHATHHSLHCSDEIVCLRGQSCFSRVGFHGHHHQKLHDYGCIPKEQCDPSAHRVSPKNDYSEACVSCCDGPLCNAHACNITVTTPQATSPMTTTPVDNRRRCLSCSGVDKPEDCQNYETCPIGEECYYFKQHRGGRLVHDFGCSKQQNCVDMLTELPDCRLTADPSHQCITCCDKDNCNSDIKVQRRCVDCLDATNTTSCRNNARECPLAEECYYFREPRNGEITHDFGCTTQQHCNQLSTILPDCHEPGNRLKQCISCCLDDLCTQEFI